MKDLLRKFKSVKRVKEATEDQLTEIVGASRAKRIVQFFAKGS